MLTIVIVHNLTILSTRRWWKKSQPPALGQRWVEVQRHVISAPKGVTDERLASVCWAFVGNPGIGVEMLGIGRAQGASAAREGGGHRLVGLVVVQLVVQLHERRPWSGWLLYSRPGCCWCPGSHASCFRLCNSVPRTDAQTQTLRVSRYCCIRIGWLNSSRRGQSLEQNPRFFSMPRYISLSSYGRPW